jgi:RNA polymerase sigma factor (sigma-70 family)
MADGDDIVQEAFISFARRAVRGELKCLDGRPIADIADDELDRYVEGCRIYLIHIALHKCGEFRRKTKTRFRVIGRWIDNVREQDGDPAEDLLRQEQLDSVQHAITRLPARLYEVLLLRFYAQCSEKEIAMHLGISVRMVKYRLHELREQLHVMLSSETETVHDHAAHGNGKQFA